MNTKTLANHYDQLTAPERFCLILAAYGRRDQTEMERLTNAAKRFTFSVCDFAPYIDALLGVLYPIYIELLEEAAHYEEWTERFDRQLSDSIAWANVRNRKKKTVSKPNRRAKESDAGELPVWHRSERIVYGLGYLFKVKMEGWALFCGRLRISPVSLWEAMDLPGLDRIKRAFALVKGGLAYPDEAAMRCWINEVRPDDPELAEAEILTAEMYAEGCEESFRSLAKDLGAR